MPYLRGLKDFFGEAIPTPKVAQEAPAGDPSAARSSIRQDVYVWSPGEGWQPEQTKMLVSERCPGVPAVGAARTGGTQHLCLAPAAARGSAPRGGPGQGMRAEGEPTSHERCCCDNGSICIAGLILIFAVKERASSKLREMFFQSHSVTSLWPYYCTMSRKKITLP